MGNYRYKKLWTNKINFFNQCPAFLNLFCIDSMHLRIIQEELLELTLKQFHIEEARSFFCRFYIYYLQFLHRDYFLCQHLHHLQQKETLKENYLKQYIIETFEIYCFSEKGDALFKMNFVGCHGITTRGLVGPDLYSITTQLNDKEIIKQVTGGVTPPLPSFEIDPVNMSNLLKYLHSLE